MVLHVYCNLPPCFAKFIGDKHNQETEVQMKTTEIMKFQSVFESWQIYKKTLNLPEEQLALGAKEIVDIQKTNAKKGHMVNLLPEAELKKHKITAWCAAWNQTPPEKGVSSHDLAYMALAQQSDIVMKAFWDLIARLDE